MLEKLHNISEDYTKEDKDIFQFDGELMDYYDLILYTSISKMR